MPVDAKPAYYENKTPPAAWAGGGVGTAC